jgi:hypothetical protein
MPEATGTGPQAGHHARKSPSPHLGGLVPKAASDSNSTSNNIAHLSPDSSTNLPRIREVVTYSSRSGVKLTLPGRTWQTTNYSLVASFVQVVATLPLAARILSPWTAGESSGFPVYPGFGLSCAHFWSSRRLQSQWAQRGRSPGFTLVVGGCVVGGAAGHGGCNAEPLLPCAFTGRRCVTGPDRARLSLSLPDGIGEGRSGLEETLCRRRRVCSRQEHRSDAMPGDTREPSTPLAVERSMRSTPSTLHSPSLVRTGPRKNVVSSP